MIDTNKRVDVPLHLEIDKIALDHKNAFPENDHEKPANHSDPAPPVIVGNVLLILLGFHPSISPTSFLMNYFFL